jgi:hypothetical protein
MQKLLSCFFPNVRFAHFDARMMPVSRDEGQLKKRMGNAALEGTDGFEAFAKFEKSARLGS